MLRLVFILVLSWSLSVRAGILAKCAQWFSQSSVENHYASPETSSGEMLLPKTAPQIDPLWWSKLVEAGKYFRLQSITSERDRVRLSAWGVGLESLRWIAKGLEAEGIRLYASKRERGGLINFDDLRTQVLEVRRLRRDTQSDFQARVDRVFRSLVHHFHSQAPIIGEKVIDNLADAPKRHRMHDMIMFFSIFGNSALYFHGSKVTFYVRPFPMFRKNLRATVQLLRPRDGVVFLEDRKADIFDWRGGHPWGQYLEIRRLDSDTDQTFQARAEQVLNELASTVP